MILFENNDFFLNGIMSGGSDLFLVVGGDDVEGRID